MRLAKIHLAYKGIDATQVDLEIRLSSVSSIEAEIRRQEREQNLNNARTFLDVMTSMKTALEGGDNSGGMGGFSEETTPPAPKEQKIDMEYATYYVLKEFMDVKDQDLKHLLKFDITKYQDQLNKDGSKKESGKLKEYRIYENSDIRAPLPTTPNKETYERIRETLEVSQINMEV